MKTEEVHVGLPNTIPCGARSRRNNQRPCRQPAMPNGRCRLHGGKSPIKHGFYTKRAIQERRELSNILKLTRSFI